MNIEYNSQESFFKKPFGAVSDNTPIQFRILISGIGIPHSVRILIKPDEGDEEFTDMYYEFSVGESSVYTAEFTPDTAGLMWYCFEINHDGGTLYYSNNSGCLGGRGEIYTQKPDKFYQLTVYDKSYTTPEWFKHTVAYQIFPDRFSNGNADGSFCGNRTDITKRNWGDMPFYKAEQFGGEYLSNDFFGGNLSGIEKKIPYLKELGITAIYLNPIFAAYSNHRYDTGDYTEIDPILGNEADFCKLCETARKNGIRIILDGVFNHTGSNSRYFNKNGEYDSLGAYQSQSSPYFDWYKFTEYPEKYECWWGMKTLPHTEESSESFRKYILSDKNSVIKKWLRLGASGWRLDVVDELPDFFVKELRSEAKAEKEDAVIIGEVWEDASNKSSYGKRREYFSGKELDSVMNYPLRNALVSGVLGKISAEEMNRRIMSLKENYPAPAFYSLLNMLSGHDIERILTVMGDVPSRHETTKDFQASYRLTDNYEIAVKRMIQITGLQMTFPGVPCVYYGDETGMQGYADPFCRQCMDFSKAIADNEIFASVKRLIALRNSSDAFSTGDFIPVYTIGNVYGYIRCNNLKKYLVLSNMSSNFERIRLDLARFKGFNIKNLYTDEQMHADNGIYFIDLPAHENKYFEVCQ